MRKGATMSIREIEFERAGFRICAPTNPRAEFLNMAAVPSGIHPGHRRCSKLMRQRGINRFRKRDVVAVRVGDHHRFDLVVSRAPAGVKSHRVEPFDFCG